MQTHIRTRWYRSIGLLVLSGFLSMGCGGTGNSGNALIGPGGSTSSTKEPMPPQQPEVPPKKPFQKGGGGMWSNGGMTHEDKKKFMQNKFAPLMRNLFSKHYQRHVSGSELHCQSCHGRAATENDFTKPSLLYPLDPKNMPSNQDPDPRKAAMVKFMWRVVLPQTRLFLGDPKVSCFSCHAEKK